MRKWKKELDWTSQKRRDSTGSYDMSWNEQMPVIKQAVILEDYSPYLWGQNKEQQTNYSTGVLVKHWGNLYEKSGCCLQKVMISLGKQLLELYDLFGTSVGVRSRRRMGKEDENFPCCLPGPGGSWVLLLNCSLWGSSGKGIEKTWIQGKGFVSGEPVSYSRCFCNWKEIMILWILKLN